MGTVRIVLWTGDTLLWEGNQGIETTTTTTRDCMEDSPRGMEL